MNGDQFYNQIVDRLNGILDPNQFQDCATDLLRRIYPGLTPMPGGSDSGMDGAIADGLGEPFPLIATTGKDVIGNLTKNINTYVNNGNRRRRAVLATSRALSPQKKIHLYARARDLGFELVNIHDQLAFANLLYRDSRWCLELLHLPSTPPPLSRIPLSARPFISAPLIGRMASLDWLRQTTGDRLLLGQPGAGKTYLLSQLAEENAGLFLVSTEPGDIAAAIRNQQPTAIMVDDAVRNLDVLLALRHMRTEMGVEFAIIATGWPGDEAPLVHSLGLTSAHVHLLEQLTRDEIVQVIYGVGLQRPNHLVREIVNQAEGRPGLAVTLALLCLQGGVHEVVFGDSLSSYVMNLAKRFIDQEAIYILAVLSVSGDAGLPLDMVARHLGMQPYQVHRIVTRLATGGLVMQMREQRVSVRPPILRFALVRDIFFRGLTIPIEPVLGLVPNRAQAALTLIGAVGLGAVIPAETLLPLIMESGSSDVWQAYAWLGREEAEWVLRVYPGALAEIAEPGLHHAPDAILPSILAAAVGDRRPLNAYPDHILRCIGQWVNSGYPGSGDAFRRRRMLLDAMESLSPGTLDWYVCGHSLELVMSPRFEDFSVDPGLGNQVTISHGLVSNDDMSQIQTLWPRVLGLIRQAPIDDWSHIHNIVSHWAHPYASGVELEETTQGLMRAFATQILVDVVSIAEHHPGVLHWVQEIKEDLGVEIPMHQDPDFDILYPLHRHDDNWRETEKAQIESARGLAERWSHTSATDVARNLSRIEYEAGLANIRWPRWTQLVCEDIAVRVEPCLPWAQAFMDVNLSSDCIFPFLQKAAEANESGWLSVASVCLEHPNQALATIMLSLTSSQPDEELLTRVMSQVGNFSGVIKWLSARCEIPEYQFRQLLHHSNASVSSAAAEGMWHCEQSGTVMSSALRGDWENVVIYTATDRHWLSEVLERRADLSFRWLQHRLENEENAYLFSVSYGHVIQSAVSSLTPDNRRALLDQIPNRDGYDALVIGLVSEFPDLYRQLLQNQQARRYHLAPLVGEPKGQWFARALLAFEAGYNPEDIAYATVHGYSLSISWSNSLAAKWQEWVQRFEQIRDHNDERIRQIGEAGRVLAQTESAEAREREHRQAVIGRD